MKLKLLPLSLLFSSLSVMSLVSCKDEDVESEMYSLSGAASGQQEVPAVTTNATGNISGTLDARNKTINYTITWSGLSGNMTGMHFHGPAPVGQNAGVLFPLTNGTGTSGSVSGTINNIPDSTVQHFLNGRIYYNIHTAARPGGEIRGQVFATR